MKRIQEERADLLRSDIRLDLPVSDRDCVDRAVDAFRAVLVEAEVRQDA